MQSSDVKQSVKENVAPAMLFDIAVFVRGANCSCLVFLKCCVVLWRFITTKVLYRQD